MEAADFVLNFTYRASAGAKTAKRDLEGVAGAMKRLARETDQFDRRQRAAERRIVGGGAGGGGGHGASVRASKARDRFNRTELRQRLRDRRREIALQEREARQNKARGARETVAGQMERVRHQLAVKRAREQALRAHGVEPKGDGVMGELAGGLGLGRFAGIAGAVAAVGLAVGFVTAKVLELGSAFGRALLEATDFAQRSQIALTSILKNGELATAQFNEVRHEAARMGLDVFTAVDSFKALANAGFDVSTARELVRMGADLEAITGSAVSAHFALKAISQIKMKGRLQAEEITGQLAEHGVSAEAVYAELGKRLGKTRTEILKMQKAGDILADTAIPAILQAVRNQLGKGKSGEFALEIAQGSLSGMFRQLKGGIANAFISLGQDIAPAATRIAQTFFGTFQKIAASPALTRARGRLLEMFQSTADWVERNWPRIEPMIIRVVDALANGFADAADFLMRHGEEVQTMLLGAATVAGMLAASVLYTTALVYAFAGGISYLVGKVTEWVASAPPAVKWLLAMINPITRLVAIWTAFGSAIAFVQEKWAALPSMLRGVVLPVGVSGIGAATGAGGVHTPSEQALTGTLGGGVGLGDPRGAGSSRSVTMGNVQVNVEALDLDDPEGAGNKIGSVVRRIVARELETGLT